MTPTGIRRLGVFILCVLLQASVHAEEEVRPPAAVRPSALLNEKTPEWLTFGFTYRFRTEGRETDASPQDDTYGLGRLLVDISVKPKPWLAFHVQGQDARAPGKENATPFFRDPLDLRQAWVEMGNREKGGFRLRAGRQELSYGVQRLVGPLDWSNTARQFDAVKAVIGAKDMNVHVFAASLVRIDDGKFNRSGEGKNLHGVYVHLNRLFPNTTLEPYLLWKTDPLVIGESGRAADADTYTAGFRFARPMPKGFDVAGEWARQFGSFAGDDISAWGAYGILGFTPPGTPLSPRFSVEYQIGSGDSDPADGDYETFDQLYPTAHLYQGVADRVGWRNIKDIRAGVELKPYQNLKLTFDYFSFWLAERQDHFYGAGGQVAVRSPPGGARNTHIGQEIDAVAAWKATDFATAGAGVGRFLSGGFLEQSRSGAGSQTFFYLFLNYSF